MGSIANIRYLACQEKDLTPVAKILESNDLPHEDLSLDKMHIILAKENNSILGSIGIETLGRHGLLRSFVVVPDKRNSGVGQSLFDHLITYAESNGLEDLHLLTDTAEDYFAARGFKKRERSEAPEEVQRTTEFTSLCPSTSVYLRKVL